MLSNNSLLHPQTFSKSVQFLQKSSIMQHSKQPSGNVITIYRIIGL
jgi:hypothetical protein